MDGIHIAKFLLVLTITVLRLCRAVSAIPMAVSMLSATVVPGGKASRKMLIMPTPGSYTTDTSLPSGVLTIRATTCLVFVASRTEAEKLSNFR